MVTRALHERVTALGLSSVTGAASRSAGTLRMTVIAKATFGFAADAEMRCVTPQPIFTAEVHHADNPMRSVRFSNDRAPYLGQAEAFFTGHAYAPEGSLVESTTVRFAIFDEARAVIDRTLKVTKPGGFKKVALLYENAFGGLGCQDNPFGVGADGGAAQPSVVDPVDATRPGCFGPIGSSWPSRRRKLGKVTRAQLDAPIAEIPEGFDWSYFQAAPEDQRAPFFHGNEWIVLEGLHRSLPVLRTRLPGARGLARVYGLAPFGVAEGQPLILHADTLRVDGDDQRCTLTFRGIFPVVSEAALDAIQVLAGVELSGEPLMWPASSLLDAPATSPGRAKTVELSWEQTSIPLDDDEIELVESQGFGGTLVLGDDPADDDDDDDSATGTVKGFLPGIVKPALPFAGKVSALARAPAPAPANPFTGTMVQDDDDDAVRTVKAVLPFPEAPRVAPVPPPARVPAVALEPEPLPAVTAPAIPSPPAAPLVTAAVPPAVTAPTVAESPWAPAPAPAPAPQPAPVPPTATRALKKALYGRFSR